MSLTIFLYNEASVVAILIGKLLPSLSEQVFYLISTSTALITEIYTVVGTTFPLLVFIIDSDSLSFFSGALATSIAAILPDGAPPSYFDSDYFSFSSLQMILLLKYHLLKYIHFPPQYFILIIELDYNVFLIHHPTWPLYPLEHSPNISHNECYISSVPHSLPLQQYIYIYGGTLSLFLIYYTFNFIL